MPARSLNLVAGSLYHLRSRSATGPRSHWIHTPHQLPRTARDDTIGQRLMTPLASDLALREQRRCRVASRICAGPTLHIAWPVPPASHHVLTLLAKPKRNAPVLENSQFRWLALAFRWTFFWETRCCPFSEGRGVYSTNRRYLSSQPTRCPYTRSQDFDPCVIHPHDKLPAHRCYMWRRTMATGAVLL